jgi:hypothetical protein
MTGEVVTWQPLRCVRAPHLEDLMKRSEVATKQADLASGIGAGVLGVGLGVLLADDLRPIAAIVLLLGAVVHGWAMWRKHQLEKSAQVELPHWSVVLYWVCWLAFPAMAAIIVARSSLLNG